MIIIEKLKLGIKNIFNNNSIVNRPVTNTNTTNNTTNTNNTVINTDIPNVLYDFNIKIYIGDVLKENFGVTSIDKMCDNINGEIEILIIDSDKNSKRLLDYSGDQNKKLIITDLKNNKEYNFKKFGIESGTNRIDINYILSEIIYK